MAETFRKFEFYPRYEAPRSRPPAPRRALSWIQRNLGVHCCALIANELRQQPAPVHSITTSAQVGEAQALSWCVDPELHAARRNGHLTLGYAGYLRCFGSPSNFIRSPGARRSGFELYRPPGKGWSG